MNCCAKKQIFGKTKTIFGKQKPKFCWLKIKKKLKIGKKNIEKTV